jgi:hypothetical protein
MKMKVLSLSLYLSVIEWVMGRQGNPAYMGVGVRKIKWEEIETRGHVKPLNMSRTTNDALKIIYDVFRVGLKSAPNRMRLLGCTCKALG